MIVTNDDIIRLMNEIRFDFSNSQYLSISGEHDFENVRGSRLWYLWYGLENLSIASLETEYYRYLGGKYTAKQFYRELKHLYRCFKHEFTIIKIKIILERYVLL